MNSVKSNNSNNSNNSKSSDKSFNVSITENMIVSLEKSYQEVALNAISQVCKIYQLDLDEVLQKIGFNKDFNVKINVMPDENRKKEYQFSFFY